MARDAKVIRHLERIAKVEFVGQVWRLTWASRDPTRGGIRGGRWSLRDGQETLYTAQTRDGAIAEIGYRLVQMDGPIPTASLALSRLTVRCRAAINCTRPVMPAF